jgi:hypothetical protein
VLALEEEDVREKWSECQRLLYTLIQRGISTFESRPSE